MPRTLGSPREVKHDVMNHRLYGKPSIHKFVVRTKDVNRTSEKVIKQNEEFKKIAAEVTKACRGQPWDEFIKCKREKMIEKIGLSKSKELGFAYSKTPGYRKRFWVHKEAA